MSKEVKPDQVMSYLNELFSAFDVLVDTYKIYKVCPFRAALRLTILLADSETNKLNILEYAF